MLTNLPTERGSNGRLRRELRRLLAAVDSSRMALAPDRTAAPSRFTYGRRKQIPILVGAIVVGLYSGRDRPLRTHAGVRVHPSSRGSRGRAYRFWTIPMTPRYAAAVARRKRWRATPMSPKLAFGVIGAIVAFYGLLFVAILVLK